MLTGLKVSEFINRVASDSPAPGGGSVAAVTAAQGIALTRMVALLTVGKKKYAQYDALMGEISAKAEVLANKLTAYVDKDTEAYNGVSAVFALPKNTDEEKKARSAAMQTALKAAAAVPFEVMELCVEALKLTEEAVGKSNTNAASDLGVAALNIGAGAMGAWLNVKINLAGIKDADFTARYGQQGATLDKEAQAISARIYEQILTSLEG
ncbi:MAG: cyclodeaminase/cyclohydrolase family protein [Defluviitaleaceae bacterium]|nr:cyclodeaminase/cyclohydrolase family protein [Defluviitaleaceae bacterium]MCL2240066.1 cyclodeaminase/cyclohydrolase family protein [Defluviitaleaceae bacterium]MCL2240281.1 cyclodeaminase/cyclohydrolase family protein [Defluviitaleaceae bacterium]